MGAFAEVVIKNVTLDQATFDPRSVYGAEAKAIVVTDFEGTALIEDCIVKRVKTSSGIDDDGYGVHCKYNGNNQTRGSVRFVNCQGFDNQGRHIKNQCSNTIIEGAYYERKNLISIEQGVDFDFQAGNGVLQNVHVAYKIGDNNSSPLGRNFMTVAAQNRQSDKVKRTLIKNISMETEVIIPKFVHLFNGSTLAKVTIEHIHVKSRLENVIGRTFCEFVGDEVQFGGLDLEIKNCLFNATAPFLAYTSPKEHSLTGKLNIFMQNNEAGNYSKVLYHLSGKQIHHFQFKSL